MEWWPHIFLRPNQWSKHADLLQVTIWLIMQPARNKLRPRLPAIMLERRGTLIYFNQVLDRTRDLFCTWSISQFVTCSMGTRYKRFLLTYFSVIFLKLSSCLSSEEEEQIKIEWIMSVILLLIIVWLGAVTTTSNPMDAKPKACIGRCVANEFTKVHLCLQLGSTNRSPEYF